MFYPAKKLNQINVQRKMTAIFLKLISSIIIIEAYNLMISRGFSNPLGRILSV